MTEIFQKATHFNHKVAIVDENGSYTYQHLLASARAIAFQLLKGEKDLKEERVAFMVAPGFEYVAVQWGIWLAGGVAVPLSLSYPLPSLRYVLEDTKATLLISEPAYYNTLEKLMDTNTFHYFSTEVLFGSKEPTGVGLPYVDASRNAMILYTSGTTNLPKGVVSTHKNLSFQTKTLVDSWQWNGNDYTLNVLPLHHVHGIVNVTCCALWTGATVEFTREFSPEFVFKKFAAQSLSVFMAVPTIYFKLISYWESLAEDEKLKSSKALAQLRLMVSGSAALPVSVMEKWKAISGHTLLERYGMTEIGMAISNPYDGERKAGYIGVPLPGVGVRLMDETGVIKAEDIPGEIQIQGGNVFKEYWGKPEATLEAFTADGWFKTGDVAVVERGYYRILGRSSVDIIKSGGYKISALEIEEVLRQHMEIGDCAVVGVPDDEWGELVVAALVPKEHTVDTKGLNEWVRSQMPAYKVPRNYAIVKELPRNTMGKVTKNEVKELFKTTEK
jgi:malonyl-CoA/methylmalonyl-CoA synthetase